MMNKKKYDIKSTAQFKKDYKLAKKRGLDIKLLAKVINTLAEGVALPAKHKDHASKANGKAAANVTSCRTGCSCTKKRKQRWYWTCSAPAPTAIFSATNRCRFLQSP